jgi:hypothetical protein
MQFPVMSYRYVRLLTIVVSLLTTLAVYAFLGSNDAWLRSAVFGGLGGGCVAAAGVALLRLRALSYPARASIAIESGDASIIQRLRAEIDTDPHPAARRAAALLSGWEHMRRHEWYQARESYLAADLGALAPKVRLAALQELALAATYGGLVAEAVVYAERAVAEGRIVDRGHPNASLDDARRRGILGAALAAGGRDLEATPLLERAKEADHERAYFWEPLLALCEGRHLRSIGRHEEAVFRLARALDAGGLWGIEAKKLLDAYWAAAREHGDLALARVLGSTYPEPSTDPRLEAVRLSGVAQELIVRQEWAGARAVLERIELQWFASEARVLMVSDLALVTALTGDVDRALHVAIEAVQNAHLLPDVEKRATVHGIYAVTLSLAGRHEEALAMFAALREHGTPRERSLLAYFEGESLLQLGCTVDARKAYVLATSIDAYENRWSRLARQMIEAIDAQEFAATA